MVTAVFAGVGFFLHAQDGDKQGAKGKVLLLKSGHAMEGDIEKVGTQLCVRRGKSEVWIAEDKALRLCTDWDDAFAFVFAQIKGDDAGDRVRLARWCHLHRLNEKALEQARIAVEIQPNHADAKQIVRLLERALKEPAPAPRPVVPIVSAQPAEATPTVDVSFETTVAYSTKVQPILMNLCATCHANGAGGKFRLERVSESNQKGSTQRNLAAVLTYVDLDHPAISPLLVMAITKHGDAPAAPIRDRSAKPLQSMQQWIEQTVAKNPQLKDYARKKTPDKLPPSSPGRGGEGSKFPMLRTTAPAPGEDVVSQPVPRLEIDAKNPPRVQPAEQTKASAPATPVDEFDPLRFNMWAHPQHFRQQAASNRP